MESQIACTPMNQSLMASCDYLTKSAPSLAQIMVYKFNNDWLNPKTSSKSEEGSMYHHISKSSLLGQGSIVDCHQSI